MAPLQTPPLRNIWENHTGTAPIEFAGPADRPSDARNFEARAAVVVAQYAGYTSYGKPLNGELAGTPPSRRRPRSLPTYMLEAALPCFFSRENVHSGSGL